ncbi:phosphatase PAP2 family protein [Myxacorys almedinensis]|uniref:Phosphatase PAP2 family protein n=1 Tax=Myxacorys almedinensis A TaxID=2690445 RepID=A0A8J8CK87_9CYAN|nr:phosphatase PAP2 family protein [Myxacorys almedinensis]NDJ18351.1 phosphatase PAP2 family protein [Myxacorys almedinensis A]
MLKLIRHASQSLISWGRRVGLSFVPLLTAVRLAGLVLAAIALWGFAEIAEDVLEKETYAFDVSVLFAIQQVQEPWLNPIMLGITTVGDPGVLVALCLLVSLWLIWRRHRPEAFTIAIAAVGALGLNMLLKTLFERDRPQLWARTVDVRFYSFPSGHAMLSMVILGLFGYLLASRLSRWRTQIISGTAVLILLIGFSRLYFGVHWLTDIVAGYAAGFVWLVACLLSLEIHKQRHQLPSSEQ